MSDQEKYNTIQGKYNKMYSDCKSIIDVLQDKMAIGLHAHAYYNKEVLTRNEIGQVISNLCIKYMEKPNEQDMDCLAEYGIKCSCPMCIEESDIYICSCNRIVNKDEKCVCQTESNVYQEEKKFKEKTQLCKYFEQGYCRNVKCMFAHGKNELVPTTTCKETINGVNVGCGKTGHTYDECYYQWCENCKDKHWPGIYDDCYYCKYCKGEHLWDECPQAFCKTCETPGVWTQSCCGL